jgi:hypothetical protein
MINELPNWIKFSKEQGKYITIMQNEKTINFCSCGHIGGNSPTENQCHENNVQIGHGKCLVNDCPCAKFFWIRSIEI